MAPDKIVAFLFHLRVRDGVAMSARLHAAKFPVPAQTPSSLAQGAAMQCNAAEEVKGSCAMASRCPVFDCSRPTLQSVEWAATHPCPGAICVSQLNHGMGRNLLLPIFCRTHFLSFGRQTCCLHNTTARQVSRNKTKTGDTLLKRFYQTA